MDARLKRDNLYFQLKQIILDGTYKHGMKFPSEMKLIEKYAVSRVTIRAALKQLEADGLLLRIRPKGTFVNTPDLNNRLILAFVHSENDVAESRNYILPGIQHAAKQKGYCFELCPVDFIDKSFSTYCSKKISGAIIFGGRYTGEEKYIQFLKATGCPVIMAGCYPRDVRNIGFAGVRPDRETAWLDGLRALKKSGHTRISILTDPLGIQGVTDYDEYYDMLRSEDLYNPELMFFSKYDPSEIKKTFLKIINMRNAPTAIMCYSDFYAMFIMRAAEEIGIKIPEDICIMGFSGYPGTRFLNPPLATVDLNYFKLGTATVDLIANATDWFRKSSIAIPEVIIPHKVVIRQSAKICRIESNFVI